MSKAITGTSVSKGVVSGSSKATIRNQHATSKDPNNTNGQETNLVSSTHNGGNPLVTFQGRTATPISLIEHRHITYISPIKNKEHENDINVIDEENSPAASPKKRVTEQALPIPTRKMNIPGNAFSTTQSLHKEIEEYEVVQLGETVTEIIFSLNSFIAASDTRSIVVIEEKNAKYLSLIEAHKNPDGFTDSSAQTLNHPQKNKDQMTTPSAVREMACQASSYEILDEMSAGFLHGEDAEQTAVGAPDDRDPAGLSPHIRQLLSETLQVARATPGCLLDTSLITKPTYNYVIDTRHKKAGDGGGTTGSTTNALAAGTSRRVNAAAGGASRAASNIGKTASGKKAASIAGGASDGVATVNPDVELIVELKEKTDILLDEQSAKIMQSKQLLKSLQIAERAIQQNAYHHKHLDYRDLPDGGTTPLLSASLMDHTENSASKIGITVSGSKSVSDGKKARSVRSGTISKSNAKNINSPKPSTFGAESGMGRQSNFGDSQSRAESVKSGDDRVDERVGELEDAEMKADKTEGEIHQLYSYKNEQLVRGRPVTSMCWSCVNLDLLTVGYGALETVLDAYKAGVAVDEELVGGLVLFWSLRNPDYPEKILRTPHAVTCLDFSKQTPSLLAVGLINGDVLVYDMRRQRDADWGVPAESSAKISGGHTDPVWQVTWVLKGSDRLETLVSISTDGNVLEWNLKKGLVVTMLMQLKKDGVGEGWITRKAAGLCFDFLPNDPSSYIAGTEDGNVHHCSIAYNEQYLNTFEKASGGACHDGPVQRITFSPHLPDIFLTCSADWTMSLFHSKQKVSLFSMHSSGDDHCIQDICWCPGNSTLFAAVTKSKLQIWDLSVSCIDPVVNVDTSSPADKALIGKEVKSGEYDSRPGTAESHNSFSNEEKGDQKDKAKDSAVFKLLKNLAFPSKIKSLTCVKFGERSPVVAVGDNFGVVSVYRVLSPISITHEGPLLQADKLRKAVLKHTDPEKTNKLLENFNRVQAVPSTIASINSSEAILSSVSAVEVGTSEAKT